MSARFRGGSACRSPTFQAPPHPAGSRSARGREERPHPPLRASRTIRGRAAGGGVLDLGCCSFQFQGATDVSQLAPTRSDGGRNSRPPLAPSPVASVDVSVALLVSSALPRLYGPWSAWRRTRADRSSHAASVFDPSGFRNRKAPLAALFESICQSCTLSGVATPRRNTLPKSSATCPIGPRYTAWCVAAPAGAPACAPDPQLTHRHAVDDEVRRLRQLLDLNPGESGAHQIVDHSPVAGTCCTAAAGPGSAGLGRLGRSPARPWM